MEKNSLKLSFGNIHLKGILSIPPSAKGIVLFAHGSGSSRFSPRNQLVAHFLNQHHIATLLIDLLTPKEDEIDERTREFRFNIDLLAQRLIWVTDWLLQDSRTQPHAIGYFGASTGAAAALIAAAKKKEAVSAVVSRGGRPDLAHSFLTQVQAPTLLIVGENDPEVIELNRQAYKLLACPKKLEIIPGATHLFEESGCLEKAAHLSSDWFAKYLMN
jgi:putative phosphoribosyl transferase